MSGLIQAVYEETWPRGYPLDCFVHRLLCGGKRGSVPTYSRRMDYTARVLAAMEQRGYWCQMRTKFDRSDQYCWAGFTPHSCTGWNGTADYSVGAFTVAEAVCYAALLTTEEGRRMLGVEMPSSALPGVDGAEGGPAGENGAPSLSAPVRGDCG